MQRGNSSNHDSTDNNNVQLQGFQFPNAVRVAGTSVEVIRCKAKGEVLSSWAAANRLSPEKPWGIIASARSKTEELYLSLGFRKVTRTRLAFKDGRVEKKEEESTEPETAEFHLRNDGVLELYSCSAKQRALILRSLSEAAGKENLNSLYLPNEAMLKLMEEAVEVLSVSVTGLGNPFFSDATLTGADPWHSKTCKELVSSGEIKAFRGKFSLDAKDSEGGEILMVTVYSNCKLRFFPGQQVQVQSDLEDFVAKTKALAVAASTEAEK